MAVPIINKKTGEIKKFLYNPSERASMYAQDLATGFNIKNQKLSNTQLAFRSGYLKARKDSAKAFKHKNPNYVRKNNSYKNEIIVI